MRCTFAALAIALAGCATRPGDGTFMRMAPGAVGFDGVKVTISVKDQQVRVEAEAGVAEIEFSGVTAHVRLAGGQRLTVTFDARARSFNVEVLEDADSALDVGIGQAVIHATKGDVFEARVVGESLDVVVRRGLVQVMGPDRKSEEVGQGSQITVAGGSRGAIHGVPPPVPVSAAGPKRPPREPRRPLILDRTDIAPAP